MAFLILATDFAGIALAEELPKISLIQRRIPPRGMDLPADIEATLTESLSKLQSRLDGRREHPQHADVAALLKAVRFAIELGEFYKPGDVKKAEMLLEEASRRLDAMGRGKTPWRSQRGPVVRGFVSKVDGSPQPYGVHVPEDLDLSKRQPLIVWLHGRGDSKTDMHFLVERMASKGQIAPEWAITVHPFGRQCVGYKSAGETDVLEAIKAMRENYRIDDDRIILMGFSMGGAGAWHLGAHYADRWAAVSPGAGFAETARYQRLTPENYPPEYEQKLWGVYDAPNYVRNLFNTRVVAYSGEMDKQIQAARVMEEAFEEEGQKLTHLIGPGMGHKYHADVLVDILDRMHEAAQQGRPTLPKEVHLQTRTLRYDRMHWLQAHRLEKHWEDSRIDAKLVDGESVQITTRNIESLSVNTHLKPGTTIRIDGQELSTAAEQPRDYSLTKVNGKWNATPLIFTDRPPEPWKLPPPKIKDFEKKHGRQGPIDDAFRDSFLFVLPSGEFASERVKQWVEFEAAHQMKRWRELFRGEVRVKRDTEVTSSDVMWKNLILWGDPSSNRLIREFVAHEDQPLKWTRGKLTIGGQEYDTATHVPVMIYPNPASRDCYLVINSGPTFREAHDRTNSLQNPKLPDWAVLDIASPPTAEAAGRVVAADFFNEYWQ